MSDTTTSNPAAGELRTIALSSITVRDGFNPRTGFDEAAIARLADTIRTDGVLQPLLVQPSRETASGYELVDGERRYRAAFQVGMTEVPGPGPPARRRDRRPDRRADRELPPRRPHASRGGARVPATARRRPDAQGRQRAAARLARAGPRPAGDPAAARGTASRASTTARSRSARCGRSPPWRRSTPACPPARCGASAPQPTDAWRRRVTWADVHADPIGAVTSQYGDETPDLPDGVYEAYADYPLSAFALGERAEKDLAALVRLNPAYAEREQVSVRFDRDDVETAAKLGAAHASEHGHSALILGAEVAEQLVADQLKRQLREERARARRQREAGRRRLAARTRARLTAPPARCRSPRPRSRPRRGVPPSARPSRNAAPRRWRSTSSSGVAVLKAFAKTTIDARVVKVLSAVDFKDDLDALAAARRALRVPRLARRADDHRPARPRPSTSNATRQARRRTSSSPAPSARRRSPAAASRSWSWPCSPTRRASRSPTARSSRSATTSRPPTRSPARRARGLPWRRDVAALVEELALERLPEHLTTRLRTPSAPEPARRGQRHAGRARGRDRTGGRDGRLTTSRPPSPPANRPPDRTHAMSGRPSARPPARRP